MRRAPWKINQFVSLDTSKPLKLVFIQEGWKEISHPRIIESKNKIEHVESMSDWEFRKKITNPYEPVFSGDDGSFPSLAKVQPLSRSYFKMIEMLHLLEFWESVDTSKSFIASHACEGPGGFIQAVIEGCYDKKIPVKNIYAITLKPTKSHIPGWRRSTNFLKKHKEIQIEYGADDTGNILNIQNQRAFSIKSQGSQLFTADGGFDFSTDYTNQEQTVFPLLLASFTLGLMCLDKGGTMIIKTFDIYGKATQDLLLGTAFFFKKFTIYKPATSRPCNSERYFIAKGYKGKEYADVQEWIKHLQTAQVKHKHSPLTQLVEGPWPDDLMGAVKEQIHMQEENQIDTINDTLSLDRYTIKQRVLENISLSKEWCKTFGIKY